MVTKKKKSKPRPKKTKSISKPKPWVEWKDVKTVEECEETATMDAYDEYEQASGWLTCLEEILEGVEQVVCMGNPVKFTGLDLSGDTVVVAVIGRQGKTAKVALDSIELIKPTKAQALWLKAYVQCGGC
ncbi:hypothetical protein WDW37_18920 [Bdellovibrionota bacterium FG-1]